MLVSVGGNSPSPLSSCMMVTTEMLIHPSHWHVRDKLSEGLQGGLELIA